MIFPMKGLLKIAPYAAPAFIVTATIPVVWRFAKSIRQAKPIKNEGLYEDKGGKATEESMTKHSTKKAFILIFIGVGFGMAQLSPGHPNPPSNANHM
jgi:hypothetical protein